MSLKQDGSELARLSSNDVAEQRRHVSCAVLPERARRRRKAQPAITWAHAALIGGNGTDTVTPTGPLWPNCRLLVRHKRQIHLEPGKDAQRRRYCWPAARPPVHAKVAARVSADL
jgi:hypothetical protein